MIANMISSYYKYPNLQFQQELEYQATQLPQKAKKIRGGEFFGGEQ